jgi:hypothetical protein
VPPTLQTRPSVATRENAHRIDDLHNSLSPSQRKNETTFSTYTAPMISVLQAGSSYGDYGQLLWYLQFTVDWVVPPRERRNLGTRNEYTLAGETVGLGPRAPRKGEVHIVSFLAKSLVNFFKSLVVAFFSFCQFEYHNVILYVRSSHSLTCSTCSAQYPREGSCK